MENNKLGTKNIRHWDKAKNLLPATILYICTTKHGVQTPKLSVKTWQF